MALVVGWLAGDEFERLRRSEQRRARTGRHGDAKLRSQIR
jgi:hypothetical protein